MAYHERGANDVISDLTENCDSVFVSVHGDSCVLHTYPTSADEDAQQRHQFELDTCLPTVNAEADHIREIPLSGPVHGVRWHSLVVIPEGYIAACRRRTTPQCIIMSDVESDIHALQHSVRNTTDVWLAVGRRGKQWFRMIFSPNGTLVDLRTLSGAGALDPGTIVTEALLAARAATGSLISRVVLFGDYLTKATLNAITSSLADVDARVERLQPYRSVRSALPPNIERSILAKAHMLGPLVGMRHQPSHIESK